MGKSGEVGEKRTLLVVDDEDNIRNFLRRLFERTGYSVLDASGAPGAVGFLEDLSQPIHLLITDQSMPGTSGPELIREARRLRPSLKVICLTARVDALSLEHDVHYVPKPFSSSVLLEKVASLLS
jgi:CheY-like chemotaxis protein